MAATAVLLPRSARPRVAGVLVVSLLLHGLLLAPLALDLWGDVTERPAVDEREPIFLDIEPRPRLRTKRASRSSKDRLRGSILRTGSLLPL